MSKVSLDIVMVNRNSGTLLRNCIKSIESISASSFFIKCVIIVDDMSTDRSAEEILSKLPVTVIQNAERLGYGASCNRGASAGDAEYILFLNTDMQLNNDSIEVPMRFLLDPSNNKIGMVGIKLFKSQNIVSRSCSRFPTPALMLNVVLGLNKLSPKIFPSPALSEWDHLDSRPVDQIIGAFLIIRRELFVTLGGYDEHFFVYYEDLDLSLRAKKLGYQNMYLASASAFHMGGGTSQKYWAESLFFNRRSRLQYAWKHFGIAPAFVIGAATLVLEPIVRTCFALSTRSLKELIANWWAAAMLWRYFFYVTIGAGQRVRKI